MDDGGERMKENALRVKERVYRVCTFKFGHSGWVGNILDTK